MRRWLAMKLIQKYRWRPPDFKIGDPATMYRWYILPRNRFFNIYLHQFLASDADVALHDHPWWNCTWLLYGEYYEEDWLGYIERYQEGTIKFRRAKTPHRIIIPGDKGGLVWSLFFTGPVIREWGFWCPKGWVHWKKFVDERNSGKVGRGCGEMK